MFEFISLLGDVILLISFFLYSYSILFISKQSILNKLFTFYLGFVLTIESISTYLFFNGQNNILYSNIYLIGNIIIIGTFYYFLLYKKKLIIWITSIITLFLCIQYTSDISLLYQFNKVGLGISHIGIISFCILYFLQYIQSSNTKRFLLSNIGFLIYFLGSLLVFVGFIDIPNKTFQKNIFLINAILFALLQLFILIDFFINLKLYKKKNIQ